MIIGFLHIHVIGYNQSMIHHSPCGLIWDMDGVLIDSTPYHLRAWQETLLKVRKRMFTIEEFQRTFGMRNPDMLHEVLGVDLSLDEVSVLADKKEALYRELVRLDGISLLPGVRTWLDTAHNLGLLQTVASSAPRANVDVIVDTVHIRSSFVALIASEDVTRGKPDPEVFLAAAASMGLSPNQCIVVEDAPVGIQAAHAAGMACVGVLTTHKELEADITLYNLDEMAIGDVVGRFTHI